ncbi:MAG: hypothetical protein A7315_04935 [Candidatus Altiarchaeales archaeon WOR_SM1_79]|nr:MAG: hypothetical protein A7315_04935 [Candidatus Altiarchaeales archaeon WOR_SM1_79]
MEDIIITALTLFGAIIFLGFISKFIFEKTRIPDIVWLMVLGLLVSPIFGTETDVLFTATKIFAALALAMILFDGGLNMDARKTLQEFPRATMLAVLNLIFSMIVMAAIAVSVLGWDLLSGLLLGAIVGGSSSAIVIPLVCGLKIRERIITMLSLESAITDALCIVIAITLLDVISKGFAGPSEIAHGIASAFSIGAMIGLSAGFVWVHFTQELGRFPFSYRLNLAMILLVYAGVEYIHGSGAIAVLLFGVVLGNSATIGKFLKIKKALEVYEYDKETKTFQREVTFFIKVFFFVFLGVIVGMREVKIEMVVIGVILGVALLLARIIPAALSSMETDIGRDERRFIVMMAPRGLAAAVLAQMPLTYKEIPDIYASIFSDMISLVFVIILTSIAISIAGAVTVKEETEGAKKEIVSEEGG